jgi:hypothetical protein
MILCSFLEEFDGVEGWRGMGSKIVEYLAPDKRCGVLDKILIKGS